MKEIQLTQGFIAVVDDDDFEYLSQWKWCVAKRKNANYACRTYREKGKPKTVLMHREIMKVTETNIDVDHINQEGRYKDKWQNHKHWEILR